MTAVLAMGVTTTDRTRALFDGRVAIEGFQIDVRAGEPQALFRASQVLGELEIAEMSLGTHILQVAQGTARYQAVPVFLSRAYRHNAVFVRNGQGISSAADLNGRRIGIQGLQQTATIWIRGILREFYGFEPLTAEWVVAGLNQPGDVERTPLARAPALSMAPGRPDDTLDALLREGKIDAVFSPSPPACATDGSGIAGALFDDLVSVEQHFFRTTGFFPLMHVLGVRHDICEAHPQLPKVLFDAFSAAKSLAQKELLAGNYLRASLPWVVDATRQTRALMGNNPWRYSFASNRREIEALIGYAVADGLLETAVDPAALFNSTTLDLIDPDDRP